MKFILVVLAVLMVTIPKATAQYSYCSAPVTCGVPGTIQLQPASVPPGRRVEEIAPPEVCGLYQVVGVTAYVCADDAAPTVTCVRPFKDRVLVTRTGSEFAGAIIYMSVACGDGWKPALGASADQSSAKPIAKKVS